MLGDKKEKSQDIDALDALRRWIKETHVDYGSLKPTLTIQDGMVIVVKIQQGDMVISLKAQSPIDT